MLAVENRRNAGCGLITFSGQATSGGRNFQYALDDEHHVRAAGVIFVEHQRDVMLERPGQDAVAEFGDLLAVPDTIESLPTRSIRLMWLSRLTRTQGQFSRAATCSIWVDLPVP